jgi:hypothetical protein
VPDRQDQKAADGAVAIQAGGDVAMGISGQQLIEILHLMLEPYVKEGRDKAVDRMSHLEAALLPRFSDGADGRQEAFADPDFQGAVRDAAESFARSGEASLQDELANLLVERSKELARTRRALVLNQAIKTAGLLTQEEIGVIGTNFGVLNVFWGVSRPEDIVAIINHIAEYAIARLSTSRSTYQYLESIGAGSINALIRRHLFSHIFDQYGLIFSDEFDEIEYSQAIQIQEGEGESVLGNVGQYLIAWQVSPTISLKIKGRSRQELADNMKNAGAVGPVADRLLNLAVSKKWNEERVRTFIADNCPRFPEFTELWEQTPLHQFNLTAVGIALGHSQIRRIIPGFDTPLEIWVS